MALSVAQLVQQKTPAQMRQQLLDRLQGRGLVTKSGSGTGSMTVSGPPSLAASLVVKISTAGEPGAAAFQLSIDAGVTYATAVTVPSGGTAYATGVGVSVSFAAGASGAGTSFVLGDTFSFGTFLPTFPATAWQEGSVPRTLLEVDAEELADLTSMVSAIASSGWIQSGNGDPGAAGAWLDLLGQNVYQLTRNPAVATVGMVTLTDAASSGPFTVTPGQLWLVQTASLATSTPLRFLNTTGGVLPKGGTLTIAVAAEAPGSAYNVANSTITTMLTNLPGVTVSNPSYVGGTWITSSGTDVESDSSYGSRCANRWPTVGIGATSAAYDYWCRTASSEVTRTKVQPGASSTAISGSNASTTNILVASSAGFAVGGIVLSSTDGSYRLITATPDATHITVSPAYGAAPTTGTLSLTSGGQVDVWIAGAAGAVSGGALTAVNSYLLARLPIGSTLGPGSSSAAQATGLAVTIVATINVLTAQYATALAAVTAALTALVQATPIGGTIYLSQVIEAMNVPTGVRNSSGVTINAVAADLALTTSQVATGPTLTLTWVQL